MLVCNLVWTVWISSEILLGVVDETSSDLFVSALPFWLVWQGRCLDMGRKRLDLEKMQSN